MTTNTQNSNSITERPPVVVIMGHIDHGKSTLLDYIRKSNIVEEEAGGITQHLSAYEVEYPNENKDIKKITFLDTPGHEAFSKMRERGTGVADLAVLVVSAEDSVKAQTLEAWNTIQEAKIPYIIAINKIDKPGANIEKTKNDLTEKGIYLEGFGGDVPFVEISAKTGQGINLLLGMILLVSELGEFKGDLSIPAVGEIIESNLDKNRGISATLVIKNGTLKRGMFVIAGNAIASTRIMENFLGKTIDSVAFSSPVRIVGFDQVPPAGSGFISFENKKEAEQYILNNKTNPEIQKSGLSENTDAMMVPLILKTDALGTNEALEKEILKLNTPEVGFNIISKGIGYIGESDIKTASGSTESIIIGFNVKVERNAMDVNEKEKVNIQTFDIIYKAIDWLKEELEKQRPRKEVLDVTGKAKIIKIFSKTKERQVVGGKVVEGTLSLDNVVRILRREFELGKAKLVELQQSKIKTKTINEGLEFGMQIESKVDLAPGDIIEAYKITYK